MEWQMGLKLVGEYILHTISAVIESTAIQRFRSPLRKSLPCRTGVGVSYHVKSSIAFNSVSFVVTPFREGTTITTISGWNVTGIAIQHLIVAMEIVCNAGTK